jgi:hypothetical protein
MNVFDRFCDGRRALRDNGLGPTPRHALLVPPLGDIFTRDHCSV